MMLRLFAALALIAGVATAAAAEADIPEGMVDNPCIGLPVVAPPSVLDYIRKQYEPGRTIPVERPPAADLELLRQRKADQEKRDWADLCHYRADNARLAAAPAGARRIVFMGDSITEGWARAHPGFFAPGMVNRGISGQTTPQMLIRFQADVIALHPKLVHIMAGTNDIAGNTGATDAQSYRNNIMAMVEMAKMNRIKVILASIPPVLDFPWRPKLRPAAIVRQQNSWLRAYARQQHLIFVDYWSALADETGALRRSLTFDGVHPNAAGYDQMEPLVHDALRRAGFD